MKTQREIVQDEMRRLITKSCKNFTEVSSYQGFHNSLLKFYFKAIEASVDYEDKTISLSNSRPIDEKAEKIYDINQAVVSKVSYTNLEETLKGCLENGSLQERFYKSILFHYNNVDQESYDNVISA